MIDIYASLPHYASVLAPIWQSLGDDAGTFHASPRSAKWLGGEGIETTLGRPAHTGGPLLIAGWRDHSTYRRPLALVEHGIGQTYQHPSGHFAGGWNRGSVSLFLHPNHYSAQADRERYPEARVEVVGHPRLDGWNGPEGSAVAFAWHWDWRALPETRATWQWWWPAVLEVARERTVIGTGHPLVLDKIRPHYRRAGIEVVEDLREVVRRSKVVVGDNTSAVYEAALLGCKVVVLDAPWYRRDVEHGGRFWRWADVGVRVSERSRLREAIERAIADPSSVAQRREVILDEVDPWRDGEAAIRAADALRTLPQS